MFKVRRVTVALSAVLALSAVGSASASAALPEFAVKEGKVQQPVTFTEAGAIDLVQGSHGVQYTCLNMTGTGEITGAKTATATLTLRNCGVNGFVCTSNGAEHGKIVTPALPVQLVYLSAAKHEAALVFNYKGASFASWNCEGGVIGAGIRHGIIVPVGPVNTYENGFSLTFKGKEGVQTPTQYENAEGKLETALPELNLLGSSWSPGAVETSVELKPSRLQVEVKA